MLRSYKPGKKAQGWTIDYIASLLIFIIAAAIGVKLLTNTFQSDVFDEVNRESITVSEHLLGKGYPEHWNKDDALRLGITSSKNRLSNGKIDNFMDLNYSITKSMFGLKHDYGFYFENKNGTLVSMGDQCALGSAEITENKNLYKELRPAAYYYKDESFMAGWMTTLGADIYNGNIDPEVDNFYNNISRYEFVMMESPGIVNGGTLKLNEKMQKIEDFVQNGGLLFMSENTSINLTTAEFTTTAEFNGQVTNQDEHLEFTVGKAITDSDVTDTSFTVVDAGAVNFTKLAEYDNTAEPLVAKWSYGVGKIYYFSTVNAMYDAAVSFNNKIGAGAENYVNETRANCTSINTNLGSENIARTERLAIYDSEILKLVVVSWS